MPLKRSRGAHGGQKVSEDEKKNISLKRLEKMRREVNFRIVNEKRCAAAASGDEAPAEMMKKQIFLVEELEVVKQTFNRSLDARDHTARLVLDAVDLSEEQYQRNFRSHAETIDRLVRIYRSRLTELQDRNRQLVNEVIAKVYEGIDDRDNELELRSMIFNANAQIEESLVDRRSAAIAKVDIFRENNANRRRMTAAALEKEMSDRWTELRSVLSDYENATKERRKAYEILRAKDDRERSIIKRQRSTMRTLFELIRKFKDNIAQLSYNSTIPEITMEHQFFDSTYKDARQRLFADQKRDKERLTLLTREYNLTMAHLKKLLLKAEKLLTMLQECRKYETEDEKIVQRAPSPEEEKMETGRAMISLGGVGVIDFGISFWKRTGDASLIVEELKIERSRLVKEKKILCDLLHHRLSEI